MQLGTDHDVVRSFLPVGNDVRGKWAVRAAHVAQSFCFCFSIIIIWWVRCRNSTTVAVQHAAPVPLYFIVVPKCGSEVTLFRNEITKNHAHNCRFPIAEIQRQRFSPFNFYRIDGDRLLGELNEILWFIYLFIPTDDGLTVELLSSKQEWTVQAVQGLMAKSSCRTGFPFRDFCLICSFVNQCVVHRLMLDFRGLCVYVWCPLIYDTIDFSAIWLTS